MHQTLRDGQTDHTDSIVSSMACIFDSKICNQKLNKDRTLIVGFDCENCQTKAIAHTQSTNFDEFPVIDC